MLQTSIAQTDLLFSQYLSDMGSYCQELYYSDAVRKIRVSDELTQAERVHVAQEIQKGLQQHQQLHSVYVTTIMETAFSHITNRPCFWKSGVCSAEEAFRTKHEPVSVCVDGQQQI